VGFVIGVIGQEDDNPNDTQWLAVDPNTRIMGVINQPSGVIQQLLNITRQSNTSYASLQEAP